MNGWKLEDIGDQGGRVAVVTGANTGLGFEVARGLASKGAKVVLACRDSGKADAAVRRIRSELPSANVLHARLDLADLKSVSGFAEEFLQAHQRLDLLVNNAGVMATPLRRTKDGFELQIGTNHLGHFALTARLFPLISRASGSRIVCVSSSAAMIGSVDPEDLNFEKRHYGSWKAYAQSKLAVLCFGLELDRRLTAVRSRTSTTMAHPGYTATDLQRHHWLMRIAVNPLFMKPPEGALCVLRAACDPQAAGGSYWGPGGLFEMKGDPVEVKVPDRALDVDVATQLWTRSEKLTGFRFDVRNEQ